MSFGKDLFKILLLVTLLYIPAALLSIQRAIDSYDQERFRSTIAVLQNSNQRTHDFLNQNDVFSACSQLNADFNSLVISSYVLESSDGSCNNPESLASLPPGEVGQISTFDIRGTQHSFIRGEQGSAKWAIGLLTPQKKSAWSYISQNQVVFMAGLREFINVFYVCSVILFVFVLIYAKEIGDYLRGRKITWGARVLEALSSVVQLNSLRRIGRATKTLATQRDALVDDLELIETSLEASILNEIRLNSLKVPYAFKGTVAKVDINGFSKVVASSSDSESSYELTNALETFGCELLQRYGGLFEKTVGDEIVVVFRGDDSEIAAFAFVRDLMEQFSTLRFKIADSEQTFTLKGAIYSSEIHFRKRPSGYGFDGEALTVSTRLLENIRKKEVNVIAIEASYESLLSPFIQSKSDILAIELKNMGTMSCYWIDQFVELSLQQNHRLLKYYKADEHIVFLLNSLFAQQTHLRFDEVIQSLRSIQVRQSGDSVAQAWTGAIQQALLVGNAQYLSKVIMLALNLIPDQQWSKDMSQLLLDIDREIEDRVNSSVIEVLAQKDLVALIESDGYPQFAGEYRSRGDLLVAAMKKELSTSTFDSLVLMVGSKNLKERNTGIYCACLVFNHYHRLNPAALATFDQYDLILKRMKEIHSSADLSQRLRQMLDHVLKGK